MIGVPAELVAPFSALAVGGSSRIIALHELSCDACPIDLQSASGGASWHPLTALLTFESAAQERQADFYDSPIVTQPGPGGDSVLLHEMTHLWCARSTRFGLTLAEEAGRLFARSRSQPEEPNNPSREVLSFIGALEPLLEGLAMYAQLDYETHGDGSPLPSPLVKIVECTEVHWRALDLPTPALFRHIRESAIYRDGYNGSPSLLDLLFRVDNDDTLHYFLGYLYVKALSAYLGRRLPMARTPEWFLPLAIKLVCDMRVPVPTGEAPVSPAVILDGFHKWVLGISEHSWTRAGRLLADPDVASWFDQWDLYAQLGAESGAEPILLDNADWLPAGTASEDHRWQDAIKAAQMVYFPWWQRGRLESGEDSEMVLIPAGHPPARLHVIPYGAAFLRNAQDERQELVGGLTANLEERFQECLQSLLGSDVTLAVLLSLSRGTVGMALWREESLVAFRPYLADTLWEEGEITPEASWIRTALDIDPCARAGFGRSLVGRAEMRTARHAAERWLAQQLVSSPIARGDLSLRLAGPAFVPVARDVERWATPSPMRTAHEISANLGDAGRAVFDLPGFRSSRDTREISFRELLPSLAPPPR